MKASDLAAELLKHPDKDVWITTVYEKTVRTYQVVNTHMDTTMDKFEIIAEKLNPGKKK